ncbi:hypothetical protein CWE12_10255 [Aliidiomarina sedimenti]|uniref:Lipoprotein n=1 Tax=Aliidiomarina sedimenti TaxID=1933879 RepID=A0ABY0BY44_9GAMM|nr:hypothetical protein [Aliidiomarina sedimenti]RUO29352.1 hypothetical protein CWE12_10255 [Aliidiomarina sedimenti]
MRAQQKLTVAVIAGVLLTSGCSDAQRSAELPAQEQFFFYLGELCGNAYRGERTVERPDSDLLQGNEALLVHFRECDENSIYAAFHIGAEQGQGDWDRSRTWIYRKHPERLELRHDHRLQDGSEDAGNTMYGGYTETDGNSTSQRFVFTERTGPNDEQLGWRVEVEPGVRYTYGTYSDDEWTWRVDFDLSQTVEPPPAAWGHEGGYIQ